MKFDRKLEAEVDKYMNKIKEEVENGKRGSTYSAIRKLGDRPFESLRATLIFQSLLKTI